MSWRILTHDTNRATKHELDSLWCTDDVIEAWDVLDAIDDARRRAQEA